MKLKKIASLMLAGIMAVSMLAGCKSGSTNNGNAGSSSSTPATTGVVASVEGALKTYASDLTVSVKSHAMMDARLAKMAESYTAEGITSGAADSDFADLIGDLFSSDYKWVENTFASEFSDKFYSMTQNSLYAVAVIPVEKTYGISASDAAATILARDLLDGLKNENSYGGTDYKMDYTLYVSMDSVEKNDGSSVSFMIAVMEASAKTV